MSLPAIGILLLMRISSAKHFHNKPPQFMKEDLNVVGSGIFTLMPAAMGITFYVTLESRCSEELDIATRMWECCETLTEGEIDCTIIKLVGGYKGLIMPGERRNITLFYPNVYVYNRIGQCLIGIWYKKQKSDLKEIRTRVYFDTSLKPHHVSISIADYYDAERRSPRSCQFIDEDVLNNCKPVDCARKYNGQRVFYSYVERRCLPASKCKTKVVNNFPHSVYCPHGNVCSNLESVISQEDIKTLNTGRGIDQELHSTTEFEFIICHNGKKSQYTGQCSCDRHWKSTTEQIRPTTLQVHLCAISKESEEDNEPSAVWEEVKVTALLLVPRFKHSIRELDKICATSISGIVVMGLLLCSVFPCIYKYFKPVCKAKPLPQENNDLKYVKDKSSPCKDISKSDENVGKCHRTNRKEKTRRKRAGKKNESKICHKTDDDQICSDEESQTDRHSSEKSCSDETFTEVKPDSQTSKTDTTKCTSCDSQPYQIKYKKRESSCKKHKKKEVCACCSTVVLSDAVQAEDNFRSKTTDEELMNTNEKSLRNVKAQMLQRAGRKGILIRDDASSRQSKTSKSSVVFKNDSSTGRSNRIKRVMRVEESNSRSMVILTKGTLPSSDSVLTIDASTDESDCTTSHTDD